MPYEPQPGTIPHRAYAWLRSMRQCGDEGPFPTSVLCDAIGVDSWGFAPFMRPAREHGIVHTSRRPGRGLALLWSLGDGKPDPGLNARPVPSDVTQATVRLPRASLPPWTPPAFRAVQFEGRVIVVGAEIRDGVAVFTREQIAHLAGVAW